ncbi:MAG: flagellar basal body L-ring protein FlgH [Sphingomonas sp.]|uniref:flagellar basal body L-ring protein FlgH n=1 Tax=unclassified Sphingomonas TaxID=196159 RepID=UPI002457EBDF|nr:MULTISPECIES: flagellar basal body L-ring protein FlgH [unclassified Sphingomonas]MBQ1496697.1 flagellar basal body L-ring protein FlgH [Sphingomonas sp.]MDH4744545.1 flagellar basal body L-ring protein FlgH [Sphingomonas sp. CBMAI 2297]
MSPGLATAAGAAALLLAAPASAQDLYKGGNWSSMAADRRASGVGDAITVVVQQAAEASNTTQNATRKSTDVSGGLNAGSINESGQLSFGGGYTGRGEVRRSERLVAQLSVTIEQVLPNGDYRIVGEQRLHVNGEKTLIAVRGRIRPEDIRSDNSVLSSRIADAQINYDGKGFVSRSARPGLLNRIFSLLGLG